jgi:membrane protease YdiL (CAAX protease family)
LKISNFQSAISNSSFCSAVLFELALGALAILLGWAAGIAPWRAVHWRLDDLLWSVAATLPPLAALFLGLRLRWEPLERLERLTREIAEQLLGRGGVLQLALVAWAAGWSEELLFRGFLQPLLGRYLDPPGALLLASLAFGLAHALTRAYAVFAMLIGLYLGWLWLHFDNLLVPILVHALYDFVALMYLLHGSQSRPPRGNV